MQSMRNSVVELGRLGPLPDADDEIADGVLERYEELLSSIDSQLNIDEARVVAGLFPRKACFGMEWMLVHLLEASESWPAALEALTNPGWADELRKRIERKAEQRDS
jgi:hypothetical protein